MYLTWSHPLFFVPLILWVVLDGSLFAHVVTILEKNSISVYVQR